MIDSGDSPRSATAAHDAHLEVELLVGLLTEFLIRLAATRAAAALWKVVGDVLAREVLIGSPPWRGTAGLLTPSALGPTRNTARVACRSRLAILATTPIGTLRVPAETVPQLMLQTSSETITLFFELLACRLGTGQPGRQLVAFGTEHNQLLPNARQLPAETSDRVLSTFALTTRPNHNTVITRFCRTCPVPSNSSGVAPHRQRHPRGTRFPNVYRGSMPPNSGRGAGASS